MLPRFESASQTAGPFVHIGLVPERAGIAQKPIVSNNLCAHGTPQGASEIEVSGQVLDGSGAPIYDAVVELWQADHRGSYQQSERSSFLGWGRSAIDQETASFTFRTIKPGQVACLGSAAMAPHLALWVVARGINIGLHTRMYFPEDDALHQTDPMLNTIEIKKRRSTLIASLRESNGSPLKIYQFNIVIQGDMETVFFDI